MRLSERVIDTHARACNYTEEAVTFQRTRTQYCRFRFRSGRACSRKCVSKVSVILMDAVRKDSVRTKQSQLDELKAECGRL
ncbi:uncharacterized protein LOC116841752 isoform X2 [Odontomachus brunneus]|uniref:uncharacterized protein LOC116841752 isoform X2 n=1 Tax=Odontomachus brunneus TaxID=486640 RepID=UPI0013F20115|nr:uncharacterized protein LOC116841752 isoform X2 [Odontomachus brunneus]